ncbi:MAG: NAD(P)H-dependent oxidoreductase [Anaerolineae bacterium]
MNILAIVGTPVYYENVSAQLKALMDRSNFLYSHEVKSEARAVGLIVVIDSTGLKETIAALKRYPKYTNARSRGLWLQPGEGSLVWGDSSPHVTATLTVDVADDKLLVVTGHASDMGDAQKNQELIEVARRLGREMVQQLKLTNKEH